LKLYGQSKADVVLEVETAVVGLRYRMEVRFWPNSVVSERLRTIPSKHCRFGGQDFAPIAWRWNCGSSAASAPLCGELHRGILTL